MFTCNLFLKGITISTEKQSDMSDLGAHHHHLRGRDVLGDLEWLESEEPVAVASALRQGGTSSGSIQSCLDMEVALYESGKILYIYIYIQQICCICFILFQSNSI